ncbi:uncharacterized protein HMPREF1541_06859 [Cyphellophora europaea CBS 101466]|uniref:HMG box domain-containing protein n=1 Tax=Cyphellophora europaea (strain CBS 101466) TaxID=1220924 RepID=W2RR74_CYPE1|nr:uncharacterized protein HMPREF1541_06859 [Cyphellophora europaea CBS 101466]ETN38820.1 hypothetical protein HMPREF1541_06859 [Cyphellophora europaea CBS 101466]
MTDLGSHLERLGLEHYLDAFLSEGFESWDTVLDIQESDFESLNIKLGHRRKLQRAIAEYRGIPYERLYGGVAYDAAPESARPAEASQLGGSVASGPGVEAKRKYRRHPKADENAPERPPSAYVIFSNKVREEIKDRNLSFTQIAKLVGDRWQKLEAKGKEPYESQANAAKERFNIQLSAYKKTDAYKDYMQYLVDFKAKHGAGGAPSEPKKPKLETQESSTGSMSGKSGDVMADALQTTHGHRRGGSTGSIGSMPVAVAPTSPARAAQGYTLAAASQQYVPSASLPSRNAPAGRGGTPPGTGRDLRWRGPPGPLGQLSNQSSVSEGSSAVRSESDPLLRTGSLSLGTPPSATPPLATQSDQGSSHDVTRPRFPGPPASLPSYGSSNYSGTMPSPAASESSWRSRPSDLRGYMDISPGSMQPPPYQPTTPAGTAISTIKLPPLTGPDRSADFQGRTLPLSRTSPTQQSGFLPTSRYSESSSGFGLPAQPRLTRQDSGPEQPLERSENDAATTLAGLASVSSSDTTPRGPSTGQPPDHRQWPFR